MALIAKAMQHRYLGVIAFLLAQSIAASAHNGPPFPLFENTRIGPCTVALWTHPDVGTGTFFVLLGPASGGSVPDDLVIKIGVQPVSRRLPEVIYDAQRVKSRGQVQYNVQAEFDRQELWRVRLILQSSQGTGEATAQVEVTPPGFGRWDLLFYALPFLAMGVLWSRAIVRSHRNKKRTSARTAGDKPARFTNDRPH